MLWKGQKTQGMHPSSLGGGVKNFRKVFAGGSEIFILVCGWGGAGSEIFIWCGGGGGVILLRGEGIILLAGSHNFEVKIKTA